MQPKGQQKNRDPAGSKSLHANTLGEADSVKLTFPEDFGFFFFLILIGESKMTAAKTKKLQ